MHAALVHATTGELVEALVPYVRDGLASDEPVHVALEAPDAAALGSALGRDAARVAWGDPEDTTRSPGRRLRSLAAVLDEHDRSGTGRVRLVAGHARPRRWSGADAEWARLDVAVNELIAGSRVEVVCTFDAAALPEAVVEHAARAHPRLGLQPAHSSPVFAAPSVLPATLHPGSLVVPPEAARLEGPARPATARSFLRGLLVGSDLEAERVEELLVAASELVTNAWTAGATRVALACWAVPGAVAVQVDDDGPGLRDPLAGYRRPALDAPGGRGLWIVRQLCDLVEIATSDTGTAVRVQAFDDASAAPGADRGPA